MSTMRALFPLCGIHTSCLVIVMSTVWSLLTDFNQMTCYREKVRIQIRVLEHGCVYVWKWVWSQWKPLSTAHLTCVCCRAVVFVCAAQPLEINLHKIPEMLQWTVYNQTAELSSCVRRVSVLSYILQRFFSEVKQFACKFWSICQV